MLCPERIISCVMNGTGKIIDSQNEVGSYPQLSEVHRPAGWDSDGDGMPDRWEKSHLGLDPEVADSNGDLDGDGYTNLEEYLHKMAALKLNKQNYRNFRKELRFWGYNIRSIGACPRRERRPQGARLQK